MAIVRRLAIVVALLLLGTACGSRELTRSKAARLIEAHEEFQKERPWLFLDPAFVRDGVAAGRWQLKRVKKGWSFVTYLELGHNRESDFLRENFERIDISSETEGLTYSATPKIGSPKVEEVTGIRTEAPYGEDVKVAEFTVRYTAPRSLRKALATNTATASTEAMLRLYDDGWRAEKMDRITWNIESKIVDIADPLSARTVNKKRPGRAATAGSPRPTAQAQAERPEEPSLLDRWIAKLRGDGSGAATEAEEPSFFDTWMQRFSPRLLWEQVTALFSREPDRETPIVAHGLLGPLGHGALGRMLRSGEIVATTRSTGTTYTHPGIDILAPLGTPIHACADGSVVDVVSTAEDPDWRTLGYMASIEHEEKIDGKPTYSVYLHMQKPPNVAIGYHVRGRTTVIGYVGNSGAARDYQTHIEIRHFRTRYLEDPAWARPWGLYGKGDLRRSALFRDNWVNPAPLVGRLVAASPGTPARQEAAAPPPSTAREAATRSPSPAAAKRIRPRPAQARSLAQRIADQVRRNGIRGVEVQQEGQAIITRGRLSDPADRRRVKIIVESLAPRLHHVDRIAVR